MTLDERSEPQQIGDFADLVRKNIKVRAALLDTTPTAIARALGVNQSAFSVKWRGERAFKLEDIEGVARVLRTTPSSLCAIRDSNPEPADSWKVLALTSVDAWELAA